MAGTSRFKLRLVGLELDNFKYTGNNRRIEIYVKVGFDELVGCWEINNTGT